VPKTSPRKASASAATSTNLAFEDLPRAMEEMHSNVQTGIPVVRIASEMPASVESLIP